MLKAFFTIFILLFSLFIKADKYYVFFTDKQGQTLIPDEYFNSHTLARRNRLNIPLVQKSDLPVNQTYLDGIAPFVDSFTTVSRWLNMACVYVQNNHVAQIEKLSFVEKIVLADKLKQGISAIETANLKPINTLLEFQTRRMQGQVFAQKSIYGEGITIAVLDAGFTGADKHPSLAHLSIAAKYDFVGKDNNPYHGSKHGTSVLSCIAGLKNDTLMGLAPKARFLLARTERNFHEFAAEEEYWLAAAEWADKNGADIINSSLGYTNNRYFIEDMDGTSLVAKAANMAFSKGILVVVSAGNDGDNAWKYIGTPADADSAFSVGAIDPSTDFKANFSSIGPNAKGVLKPNAIASGTVMACAGSESFVEVNGTSFSSPLVAGFAACLMQSFPDKNNKEIFQLLQQCGSLYPYYDYAHGYGVPLASKAFNTGTDKKPFFKITVLDGNQIVLESADSVSKDTCADDDFLRKIYYLKVQSKTGKIVFYKAAILSDFNENQWPILLNANELETAIKSPQEYEVYVHFEGYTQMTTIRW